MAASASIVARGAAGDLFFRVVDVTFDGSYPAGGYPVSARDLGFGANGTIWFIDADMSKTGLWAVAWDYTNNKLQVLDGSGAANAAGHEVIATTVLTGVVARVMAWGRGQG